MARSQVPQMSPDAGDIESGLTTGRDRTTTVSHRNGVAVVLLTTLGVLLMVIGVIHWTTQVGPAEKGWHGPVQCVAVRSTQSWREHTKCGERSKSPVLGSELLYMPKAMRRDSGWQNCTICTTEVACGATTSLPNLVDGELVDRPQNRTSRTCMSPGQSFNGFYRQNGTQTAEVELESSIEEEREMHTIQLGIAGIFLSTGGLAVLASISYALYMCLSSSLAQNVVPEVSYGDCWGPHPTWRSEYAMVKGGSSTYGGMEDCCRVCHYASCGQVTFVPCGHAVVCLTCSGLLRHCPMCDARIEGVRIDENLLL